MDIKRQSEEIANILKKVKELSQKDSCSSSDYEKLICLAKMGKELSLKKERNLRNISNNQEEMNLKNESSREIQNGIFDIISKIVDALKTVSELDLDGNKRLDNLQVTEKRIKQVSDLSISGENKQNAYLLLNEFLKIRKNAFKIIEELAFHILEKYQKREMDFSEDLFEKYRLSTLILIAFELGDDVLGKGNFIFNEFQSRELLTISKMYNAYMNGEDILEEEFISAREIPKSYYGTCLINEIENAKTRKSNIKS